MDIFTLKQKQQLTKKDLTNLAQFFDEYMQDMGDLEDKELIKTVSKIFNITRWFSDE